MWFRNYLALVFLVATTGMAFCVFAPTPLAFHITIGGLLLACLSILIGVLFIR